MLYIFRSHDGDSYNIDCMEIITTSPCYFGRFCQQYACVSINLALLAHIPQCTCFKTQIVY